MHDESQAGVTGCYRHPGRETGIRCQRCERPICPDCMQPAAVGFQCPDCVMKGRRSTRAGRTAYGGLAPTDASRTSMVLVALNALLWLAIVLTGGSSSRLFEWLALSPRGSCATGGGQYFPAAVQGTCGSGPFVPGSWMPGVVDGAYWQLLSSMFVHVGIGHLVLNCLAIYILGPQLDHVLGRWRFLALYLLSGLAGSALVYWAGPEIGGTHGASGAVFGLMAAWVVLALKRRQDYQGLLLWVGISFVYTFVMPNVSWQGHLGGFLGGLATAAVLLLAPRQRRAVVQAVGLGVVAVLVAVAIALRSLALA